MADSKDVVASQIEQADIASSNDSLRKDEEQPVSDQDWTPEEERKLV